MKLSTIEEKKSILIGMALGDGSIKRGKNAVNYNISCTHNIKQYDYMIWKMELLKENFQKNYWVSEKKSKINIQDGYKRKDSYRMFVATLGTHTLTTSIYKEMYNNRVKVVTKEILEQLTPLGIAIWYMDDGNLAYKRNKDGSICSREVTLHIQGFDYKSQQNIITYFRNTYDIDCRLHKSRDKYKLWMNTTNSIKFLKIIAKYVNEVECMRYKIDLKYNEKSIDLLK